MANAKVSAVEAEIMKYSGVGFEDAKDDIQMPIFALLQQMSPEVADKDCKAGDFYNKATETVYSGKEGVDVIPCQHKNVLVKWRPRAEGGGYMGEFPMSHADNLERSTQGYFYLDDEGNEYKESRIFTCQLITEDGLTPIVISFYSTGLAVGRKWFSRSQLKRFSNGDQMPLFGNQYHITSVKKSNNHGSWFGWEVDEGSPVTVGNFIAECKSLHDVAKKSMEQNLISYKAQPQIEQKKFGDIEY